MRALAVRGGSRSGRLASAAEPDARRRDAGNAEPLSRSGNAADGSAPPPDGRTDFHHGLLGERPGALGLVLSLSLAAGLDAQARPVGEEVQLNAWTPLAQFDPGVALQPDGGFVAVWTSVGSFGSDNDNRSVQARALGPDDGTVGTVGGEQQVNQFTSFVQHTVGSAAPIARLADGSFVVVWESYGAHGDADGFSVQARRLEPGGRPVGAEFQINQLTAGYQEDPAVAAAEDGGFLVVWENGGPSPEDAAPPGLRLRRYGPGGVPQGDELPVNAWTAGAQRRAAVARLPGGEWMVVWQSEGPASGDDELESIQGRRFADAGAPLGGQFQVNQLTAGAQTGPRLAVAEDGELVVVWRSREGVAESVRARRLAADGSPLGEEIEIAPPAALFQGRPAVAAAAGRGFVVTWAAGFDSGALGTRILGRQFGPGGAPLGEGFQVSTATGASEQRPAVAMDGAGRFVVVWDRDLLDGPESNPEIRARRFTPVVFGDGFESGDARRWGRVPDER